MSYRILLIAFLFSGEAFAKSNFVAHEWGTFTSLVGSNGITQNGMYHEDELLPNFVHPFGELTGQHTPIFEPDPGDDCGHSKVPCDILRGQVVTQKMETPVIYFYSDVPRSVEVDVRFPEGAVAETYPGPTFTTPDRNSGPGLANGHTIFNVQVEPLSRTMELRPQLPTVPTGNIYGHARAVNSSMVRSGNELEQFIFYRGLGRFQPQTMIRSALGELTFLVPHAADEVPEAFLVDVNRQGDGRLIRLGRLIPGLSTTVSATRLAMLQDHTRVVREVITGHAAHSQLVSALTSNGLTTDEAESMVNTWEHGYLRVPGLRLLYVLPRSEVEATLPLRISPEPDSVERVFVGRIEILLDTQERQLLDQVLASRDLFDVAGLGRFAEPMLRRVQQVYLETHEPSKSDLDLLNRLIRRAPAI